MFTLRLIVCSFSCSFHISLPVLSNCYETIALYSNKYVTMTNAEEVQCVRPLWIRILIVLTGVIPPFIKATVFFFMPQLYLPSGLDPLPQGEVRFSFIDVVRDDAVGNWFVVGMQVLALTTKQMSVIRSVAPRIALYFLVMFVFMGVAAVLRGRIYDSIAIAVDFINLLAWSFLAVRSWRQSDADTLDEKGNAISTETTPLVF
jgi:hypothetical protein